jgi:putative transposase
MTEKVNRGYKIRIYPKQEQAIQINKTLGCVRLIWNLSLDERIRVYETNQDNPEVYKKHKYKLQKDWKEEYPFMAEVDSQALNTTQQEQKQAFKNFYKGSHRFPMFKSRKHKRNSYTTHTTNNNVRIEGESIKLPKVGYVRLKSKRRELPVGSIIKAATVSKTLTGKYYVSLRLEYIQEVKKLDKAVTKSIGLDFSLSSFYIDSESKKANYPNYLQQTSVELAKLQKKLSRKKKDSNRYRVLRLRIAELHEKVANQRRDFHHKQSRYLVDNYDIISVETLDLKEMMKTKYFSKQINDIGYHSFTKMLEYKCHDSGKVFKKVDKYYASSKICSECGQKKKTLPLSQRIYSCECGNVIDRDYNAAMNICIEGIKSFFHIEEWTPSLA